MNALTGSLPKFFSIRVVAATLSVLLCSGILTGCIASRSEIQGGFTGKYEKNATPDKVSVLFLFQHTQQQVGFDSIPKLQTFFVKDFNEMFRDALSEISNISQYNTYTVSPQDVTLLARRQELEELRNNHDYTLELIILEESSFKQQFLSGTVTLLSLSLIPMPYSWDYTITANLTAKGGKSVHSYQRKATLDNWLGLLLFYGYAYYPLDGKREEIYSASMHNIFRQIEAEKVLKKL